MGTFAVEVVGLPWSSQRVLSHVHLNTADLDAGGKEEEVEGPKSVGKRFTDAGDTVGTTLPISRR